MHPVCIQTMTEGTEGGERSSTLDNTHSHTHTHTHTHTYTHLHTHMKEQGICAQYVYRE